MSDPILPVQPGVVFRLVPGLVAYAVGDDGSVWTRYEITGYGRLLGERWTRKSPTRNIRTGRPYVMLTYPGGRIKNWLLHRLVLETFVGPCPKGMEACHENGDQLDNRLGNLRWGTHQSNVADQHRHGTWLEGERHANAKLTNEQAAEIRRLYATGEFSMGKLGSMFGVSGIWLIVHGRTYKNAPGA